MVDSLLHSSLPQGEPEPANCRATPETMILPSSTAWGAKTAGTCKGLRQRHGVSCQALVRPYPHALVFPRAGATRRLNNLRERLSNAYSQTPKRLSLLSKLL
uniref:Uncharacterized protein n=1 Tax=Knipowitschia caucasica TaxID=637954 RepID=A0AAV2L0C3_KNICA